MAQCSLPSLRHNPVPAEFLISKWVSQHVRKRKTKRASLNSPTHHHPIPTLPTQPRTNYNTSLRIHLLNRTGPGAALEACLGTFHRPSWSSSACTVVVLLPRPLFPPLEIPAWKTSRLSFPRTDLPQALRGFCFASVSTETQRQHMGKELFFFLTPFFYFSPSLISLHKKKTFLYFFFLPTVCGCILADQ